MHRRNNLGSLAATLLAALTLVVAGCSDDVPTERDEASCSDKKDNDGDGRVDCLDPDCRPLQICGAPRPDFGADAPMGGDLGLDGGSDASLDGPAAADGLSGDTFAQLSESEPNNGSTTTEFNAITVPSLITGAIGSANDADVFSFTAQAGDRLAVTATSDGDAQLHLAVFGETSLDVPPAVNAFGQGNNAFAEYYVLKAGTYFIAVRDRRNVGSSPAGVGGASFTYSLSVAPLSRAPQALTLGQSVASQLSPAGTVRVFSFSATKDDDLELRAMAKGLTPASDVDTRLSLFHPGQKAWLGTNDNPSLSESDSLLKGKMPFTGTYHVVVENVADSGSDLRVEVSVSKKAP